MHVLALLSFLTATSSAAPFFIVPNTNFSNAGAPINCTGYLNHQNDTRPDSMNGSAFPPPFPQYNGTVSLLSVLPTGRPAVTGTGTASTQPTATFTAVIRAEVNTTFVPSNTADGPLADPLSQLLHIMPEAESCDNAQEPSECATAQSAISHLISAFAKYEVTTVPEQAALLSWIAFESAELKYNANHFPEPGRPGQGTRAMLMPNYVQEYAASIPEIASEIAGKDPAGVLAAVQSDEYSFGGAVWFYSTQCDEGLKQVVQAGSKDGWSQFISECVGTTADDGEGDKSRVAYWERAMEALGGTV